jgi:dTDP-D-glucose 4,6-dehydratase
MKTRLVTAGAGFIGSNFVRLTLARTAARVVVVDKLTSAGNPDSLGDVWSLNHRDWYDTILTNKYNRERLGLSTKRQR